MATTYLIDSNIIIDYTGQKFSGPTKQKLDDILDDSFNYSIISRMEVLVFDKTSQEELQELYFFLSFGKQYDVEISICNKVIEIRRSQNRKILPDLIIAATAIVNNHILLTRNTSDFKNIPDLQIENP